MTKSNKSIPRPETPQVNDALLVPESWKIFQVVAEFVEGYERLIHVKPSVSIFGSARTATTHPNYKMAEAIAKRLSDAGFSIVTGGGPGIMEAANKGAYAGKSLSIGLNLFIPKEQHNNKYQDIALNFRHFFTRKIMFVKYAAAYIVMPGGFGSLDEMMEVLTLMQTAKTHRAPMILVNKAYWQGLLDWFSNTLVTEGTISKTDLDLYTLVDTTEAAVQVITEYYKTNNLP
ncbi:MAG: TIGR00730 family Rossman fold protein [Thiotrichales bacterium]|nr:MAG: TIGR00730 family Rossman fold protein [Thiotrichales bacterium]